jgi:hypothetical protein
MLGKYFGLTGARAIAILVVLACELLSCVGITGVTILWAIPPSRSPESQGERGGKHGTVQQGEALTAISNSPVPSKVQEISSDPWEAARTARCGRVESSPKPRLAGLLAEYPNSAGWLGATDSIDAAEDSPTRCTGSVDSSVCRHARAAAARSHSRVRSVSCLRSAA